MADKDLYAILGVARDAEEGAIRKAYRRLARETHPDVNPNNPKAEERFKEVSFAHEVLSDADKRKRYDEFGMAGLAESFDPEQARAYQRWSEGTRESPFYESFHSQVDLEDLLFGAFGRAQRARESEPRDAHGEVSVDFLDAVRGGEVRLELAGRGALRVKIPAGADNGTTVRLAGQGEPSPDGSRRGDLYLTLRVRPHRFFQREGRDLKLELPVTVPELILGAKVEVPTPEGSVTMTIPAGSANGARLRLRGKGVEDPRGGPAGDLFVRLRAVLPDKPGAELDSLAGELQAHYEGGDVRAELKGEP